jgi:hypothetical protein
VHTVRLSSELQALIKAFAAAYVQPLPSNGLKDSITFYTSSDGTAAQHHGLPDGGLPVSMGDLEELAAFGLIDIRYGSSEMQGTFRVTSDGNYAVEQIEDHEHAIAVATVVPGDGEAIGLDWATEVLPVLQAVHASWSKSPSADGISQHAVNAELDRAPDNAATSVVLRKLEEAGYVRGTRSIEDTALARLIMVLQAQIDVEPDPIQKGKLRKVLEGIQDVGEGVMAGVLTNMIAGGT